MSKTALITGVTGQDGSYLAEFLLDKGYDVYGMVKRASNPNTQRIDHLDKLNMVNGDMTDPVSLNNIIKDVQPDEVYNLAAQSFVGYSWQQPQQTAAVNGTGVVNLLEAIRHHGNGDERIYQASTSEMFGKVQEMPQREQTPFYPRSPYGCAKLYAHWMCVNYRESYDMHINCGVLFNHESERRGLEFVTRKITDGVAKIVTGKADELRLGNLESRRDWGYAGDYVKAMYLMLQQDEPDDYVIATGETHSIQEFVEMAFAHADLDWMDYVVQDERFMRPAEVDVLVGYPEKAKQKLGWKAEVGFDELVKIMVNNDVNRQTFLGYEA
jgi:GDPmannose 4,6-dehydratase